MGGAIEDTLKDLKNRIFNAENLHIANNVFRMHYIATVMGLVIFSVLLSLGQVCFNSHRVIKLRIKNEGEVEIRASPSWTS